MEVRPASEDDRSVIRDIGRDSFETSYSLSPLQIDSIVEDVFSEQALGDRIEDPESMVLVAEDDEDGVVGFVDGEFGDEGVLRWLHVDPGARGRGAGTSLVEEAREQFEDRDIAFTARVLEEASEGKGFLERFDLHPSDSVHPDYADENLQEWVFRTGGEEENGSNEPAVEVPESVSVGGDELPLDRDDPIPGTESPFFQVYTSEAFEERYGFFCSNCGSTDVSADGLDRLECSNCGSEHRADEWDSAYL